MKAFGNQTSSVQRDRVIRISINAKYPFTTNIVLGMVWRNKILSTILKMSSELIRHSLLPVRVFESMASIRGFNRFG